MSESRGKRRKLSAPRVDGLEQRELLSANLIGSFLDVPVAVDGPFAITIRLKDVGRATAIGNVNILLELSANPNGRNAFEIGAITETVHLKPHKSVNVSLPVSLPGGSPVGNQYLVAIIQPGASRKGHQQNDRTFVTPHPIQVQNTPTPTPSPTPTPLPLTSFDGTYSGTYAGVVSQGYGTLSGSLNFTVRNGVIIVTAPGPGAGAVDQTGYGAFLSSIEELLVGVKFYGNFVLEPNGTITASGLWTYSAPLIGGDGYWTVTKTSS